MYTRCPHCRTVFRVTPRQLQASSGQVRCGRCQEVFDAFATLSSKYPVASPAAATPGQSAPASTADIGAPAAAAAASADAQPAESAQAQDDGQTPAGEAAEDEAEAPSPVLPSEPAVQGGVGADGEKAVAAAQEDRPAPARRPPAAPEGQSGLHLPEDVIDAPGESPQGRRRLRLANLGLGILAAVQLLWVFATPIALALPPLRPVLEVYCAVLGCRVGLPRLPDQLFIEASDLQLVNPARPNEVLLTATIRNRASQAQQLPLLELTLIAGANQAAARKVLRPEDYLQTRASPEQGIGANQEVEIRLYLHTSNILPSGYRLFLFFA